MQVCLAPHITTPAPHHSVFTGRLPFLPPNQQRQSTESTECANLLLNSMIHIILVNYNFIWFCDFQCCFCVSHCHVFLFSICAYQQQLLFKLTSQSTCLKCSKISKTNTRDTIAWVQHANRSATEPREQVPTSKTNLDFTAQSTASKH